LGQGVENFQQSNQTGKFSFPLGNLGTGRLKNIKLPFQSQVAQNQFAGNQQQQNQTQKLQS
jgi:hypothetical protein